MKIKLKKTKAERVYLLLRYIGFAIIVSCSILNLLEILQLASFQDFHIQNIWKLYLIGYILMIMEIVPLGFELYKLYSKKYSTTVLWVTFFLISGVAIMTGYLMFTNPMNWKNYNPDFGGLVGGLLSGLATLLVVSVSLNNEMNRSIKKARTSAGILHEILNVIGQNISRLENGSKDKIIYPKNWLDYYYEVAALTENRYLSVLLGEFDYIERINSKIDVNDFENVHRIIDIRRKYNIYSIQNWNIFDVSINLLKLEFGMEELQSWSVNKENLEIINDLRVRFHNYVEQYIYDLLKGNVSVELADIEYNLIVQLIEKLEEKNIDKRLVAKALLEICCSFNKESKLISFCWNSFSLKQIN